MCPSPVLSHVVLSTKRSDVGFPCRIIDPSFFKVILGVACYKRAGHVTVLGGHNVTVQRFRLFESPAAVFAVCANASPPAACSLQPAALLPSALQREVPLASRNLPGRRPPGLIPLKSLIKSAWICGVAKSEPVSNDTAQRATTNRRPRSGQYWCKGKCPRRNRSQPKVLRVKGSRQWLARWLTRGRKRNAI